MQRKVFIVGGGGMVGSAAAYAIAIKQIAQEIVLIDIAPDLVAGQAMDIDDAMAYTDGVRVRTGSYDEIATDDIVVITGGAPQKPGQTRLELLTVNASIIKDVITKVMAGGAVPFILMVTNPVDVLTHVALEVSGLPKSRVFGTGTTLDTARLRVELASQLHVSEIEVSAYVLGEHGDSSVTALSGATVGGVPITAMERYDAAVASHISEDIRSRVYRIIEAKKSTYYGIGQVVSEIVASMLRSAPSIYPVCSLAEGEYGLDEVVVGLPSKVSSAGVSIVDGYRLSHEEQVALEQSANIVRDAITSVRG
jgi:L-lactate dehydrogenase